MVKAKTHQNHWSVARRLKHNPVEFGVNLEKIL